MNNHTKQQLHCALHGPMITNPTGLWYTKNASGNYSTYAPSCSCDYSDDEGEGDDEEEDSSMSGDNQPETHDNYKMQVEEEDDEYENKVENDKKEVNEIKEINELEKVEDEKEHIQVQLDCALHGPMIKNPMALWYSKNASGNYSMYAPSCTCDYSDDDDDDDL